MAGRRRRWWCRFRGHWRGFYSRERSLLVDEERRAATCNLCGGKVW